MAPKIYTSSYAPLPPLQDNISLSEFIANYNPDNVPSSKPVHADTLTGKSLTYGSLRSLASQYAYGLRHNLAFALQPGQTLMAMGPNSTDFLLLAHSVWWCGGVFCPLNPSSSAKDITHALNIVQPSHLCVHPELLPKVREALASSTLNPQPRLLTINARAPPSSSLSEQAAPPLFPDDLQANKKNSLPPYSLTSAGKDSKTTPAFIAFSSGTTGPLKAVSLSHHGTISNCLQLRTSVPGLANAKAREVFFPPYCHVCKSTSPCLRSRDVWLGNAVSDAMLCA